MRCYTGCVTQHSALYNVCRIPPHESHLVYLHAIISVRHWKNCTGCQSLIRSSKVKYMWICVGVYAQTPLTCSDMDHTVLPANNTISAFTPSRRASPPFRRYPRSDGQAELTWVVGQTEINFPHEELNPHTVTHPITNRAQRTVTSLIWPTSLQLRQTSTKYKVALLMFMVHVNRCHQYLRDSVISVGVLCLLYRYFATPAMNQDDTISVWPPT